MGEKPARPAPGQVRGDEETSAVRYSWNGVSRYPRAIIGVSTPAAATRR